MNHLPSFGELYVVSDIHLGGRRHNQDNFQIFNRGKRLGNLIDHIANQRLNEDVCLVLNGDIIDSLAEEEVPGYIALNEDTALRMMDHLFTDPSFKPVWDGLDSFVNSPRRHLVFVVGNHDIELALPIVEQAVRQRLAHTEDAMGRILFATHGGGFACRVAGARVFCTHGNEVDGWNSVDFGKLGELSNAINAGRAVDPSKWKPNPGTRLVVDVMNNIKQRYPFVDLLKPEVTAVAAVLMALDKDLFKTVDLKEAFPVLRDRIQNELVKKKLLGASDYDFSKVPTPDLAEETAMQLLGPSFQEAVQQQRRDTLHPSEDDLLREAEHAVHNGQSAVAMAAEQDKQETLGVWDIVTGWIGLVPKVEGLRRALKDWLEDDRTFDVDYPDDLYQEMQSRIGSQVDFLVTGHTHKPRALVLKGGGRYYYNCGTWIRTLHLTEEVVADQNKESFEKIVWPALTAGSMAALDEPVIPGPGGKMVPLAIDRTHVVQISAQGNSVIGNLLRVTDGPSAGSVQLEPEPSTTPFKVG
ncbi:hypothetical protein C6A37_04055 [Desulfobacteraceae bacterium SEEP-SAG9]|nr:hypothetical protein C6A37_04055 [Desulfobacteraceae bacterium SEEP-SAG9]